MVEYLATPYKSLRDTYQTVQSIGARGWSNASPNASPNSGINKQNTVSNMQNEAKQRENELLKSLDEKMEKKKKELTERLARRDKNKAKSDATNDSEVDIKELNDAFDEVKSMVMSSSTARIIDDINVDGLMKAIELKVTGELKTITSESLLKVQQVMEQKEEQSMVQKVLQQHSESAEALDVSLKVKKAQESQALKERLRKRKQAS
jgi:delta 1-pyrroline-5-carboxylate dehydrogenase